VAKPYFKDTDALNLFEIQKNEVDVYAKYLAYLGYNGRQISSICEIPFLPIDIFKSHKVVSNNKLAEIIFRSSGTTLMQRSQHLIASAQDYVHNAQHIFENTYGLLSDYNFLALLPNYVQQGDSSLVYMVDYFCKKGKSKSGFYLNNVAELHAELLNLIEANEKVVLFGVTYALLDFVETYSLPANENLIVMETGGMKGRGKELTRAELHLKLKNGFGVNAIHSEYGMTELLSQAYSKGNGIFAMNDKLKVLVRDVNDPFDISTTGKGALNVIDLANKDSCAFIATADQGEVFADGTFTVLGRLDYSDIRGCSMLSL
jgi:hypothetical protein